jgi:hypothetical protein
MVSQGSLIAALGFEANGSERSQAVLCDIKIARTNLARSPLTLAI